MSEENKNIHVENEAEASVVKSEKKDKSKGAEKRPNFFVRLWRKIVKLTKDTAGELKKVVWTPKADVLKSFKLVIVTVVAVGLAIAVVDVASSWIINSIAGLIG